MIPGVASWAEVAYKVRADDLDHERAKKDSHSVVVARTPPLKATAWHGARGDFQIAVNWVFRVFHVFHLRWKPRFTRILLVEHRK